jgi:hypothetical protein
MSGSGVQGLQTGSQTVASGAFGVFPVGFGYYPTEGSRVVTTQYNWTSQALYYEDLSQLVALGVETSIQAVFIDNSNVGQNAVLIIAGTGQVIVIPAFSQGVYPVFFTGTPSFQLSVASVNPAVTRCCWLNVPAQPGVWTVGGAGAVSTAAPVLVAGTSQSLSLDTAGALRVALMPRSGNGGPVVQPANSNTLSAMLAAGTGYNQGVIAANAVGGLQLDQQSGLLIGTAALSQSDISVTTLVAGRQARCALVSVTVVTAVGIITINDRVATGTLTNTILTIPIGTPAGTLYRLEYPCSAGIAANFQGGATGTLAIAYT